MHLFLTKSAVFWPLDLVLIDLVAFHPACVTKASDLLKSLLLEVLVISVVRRDVLLHSCGPLLEIYVQMVAPKHCQFSIFHR